VRVEDDPRWVGVDALAVDPGTQFFAAAGAEAADAAAVQAQAPNGEELAERVVGGYGRLDVDDPARVVGVERIEEAHLHVDADQRRHGQVLSVHVQVEVLVDVVGVRLYLQSREAERVEAGAELSVFGRPGWRAGLETWQVGLVRDRGAEPHARAAGMAQGDGEPGGKRGGRDDAAGNEQPDGRVPGAARLLSDRGRWGGPAFPFAARLLAHRNPKCA